MCVCVFVCLCVLFYCRYVTEILGVEAYISCSVVLPALSHLHQVMKVSEEDHAYVVRFKTSSWKT